MDLHERSLYMDDTVTKNGNRVVVDNPTIFFFFFVRLFVGNWTCYTILSVSCKRIESG